ncbi:hypothetical protein C8R43DRAFT_965718 [Mycena crocata]|nr:hypothetical protein C8R43DRAFT_965718 [Mycena crocata]
MLLGDFGACLSMFEADRGEGGPGFGLEKLSDPKGKDQRPLASHLPPGTSVSALDLAIEHGAAISTPFYFNVAHRLENVMAHQAATGILDEAVEAEKSHDRSPTFPLSIPSEAISAFSSSCTADPDPSSSPSSHRKPSKKALSARRDNTHLISRSDRQLHHGRVQQASVSLGISHGGGRLVSTPHIF